MPYTTARSIDLRSPRRPGNRGCLIEAVIFLVVLSMLGLIVVNNYQQAGAPPRQIAPNVYHFGNLETQLPAFLAQHPGLEVQSMTAESYGVYGTTSGYKVVFREKE